MPIHNYNCMQPGVHNYRALNSDIHINTIQNKILFVHVNIEFVNDDCYLSLFRVWHFKMWTIVHYDSFSHHKEPSRLLTY